MAVAGVEVMVTVVLGVVVVSMPRRRGSSESCRHGGLQGGLSSQSTSVTISVSQVYVNISWWLRRLRVQPHCPHGRRRCRP